MDDSGEDDDFGEFPHCIICHQGDAAGPLIHACNCLGDHGLYHWPCLAGMIESMKDLSCSLCRQRFNDPRIQRYQYMPTFMQFLSGDVWRTPGDMIYLGGPFGIWAIICSSVIVYFADDNYLYLLALFICFAAFMMAMLGARQQYNDYIADGNYPLHFTRLLELPDVPGGVMVIDVTETIRGLQQPAQIDEQLDQEELEEEEEFDIFDEENEGQNLEELEAPEPMPAIQPGPRLLGRGQPLPQRRRHSFSGQESRRQTTHQRRHSQ